MCAVGVDVGFAGMVDIELNGDVLRLEHRSE